MLRSLKILVREIGWKNTWRVVRHMSAQKKAGEPYGALPAADSERERLSREQIEPAILLYKALRTYCPQEALSVTERIVVDDGIRFLRRSLGVISPTKLASLSPGQRKTFAESKAKKFFNASIRWDRIETDHIHFTVTACRFPPLCKAVGVPEISPFFCAVDSQYFGSVEENVLLERSQTIASGASDCPFTLRVASSQAHE